MKRRSFLGTVIGSLLGGSFIGREQTATIDLASFNNGGADPDRCGDLRVVRSSDGQVIAMEILDHERGWQTIQVVRLMTPCTRKVSDENL